MSPVWLRNRVTTEYRPVELDSEEFEELRQTIGSDGRPVWEQTGTQDAAAFARREENDSLRPEDVGDEGQPVGNLTAAGLGPDHLVADDVQKGEPTPAERANAEEQGWESEVEEGSGTNYSSWSKDELVAEAKARGVSHTGKKDELAARLAEADGLEDYADSEGVAQDPLPEGDPAPDTDN